MSHDFSEVDDLFFHDGFVNRIPDRDCGKTVTGVCKDIIFAIGIDTGEEVFEDAGVAAAMTADTRFDPESKSVKVIGFGRFIGFDSFPASRMDDNNGKLKNASWKILCLNQFSDSP